jgi:hypothetical protein
LKPGIPAEERKDSPELTTVWFINAGANVNLGNVLTVVSLEAIHLGLRRHLLFAPITDALCSGRPYQTDAMPAAKPTAALNGH